MKKIVICLFMFATINSHAASKSTKVYTRTIVIRSTNLAVYNEMNRMLPVILQNARTATSSTSVTVKR